MTEVKHTPGPWRTVYRKATRRTLIFPADKDLPLAQIWVHELGFPTKDEAAANANLIAAAPDLLCALDSLTRWLKSHHESEDEFYVQSMEQSRSAIEKAVGGAQ